MFYYHEPASCVAPPGAPGQEATDTKQKTTEKGRSAAEKFLSVNSVPAFVDDCSLLLPFFADV